MTTIVTLTRRTAIVTALCLALAGGIGAGLVGLLVGPTIFSQIDDTRHAIKVSCHLLNRAIVQSQQAASSPSSATNLLIAEIVEGMTPSEQRAYQRAQADATTNVGAQRNPCGEIAARAYD